MEFKKIKLKEILKQYRIEHRVQDNVIYKQVTISKHTGVNYRGEKLGKEIGRKRQFLIDLDLHPNTFMFVRQGVKDGSFGFAPLEVNKCIVTENMPMFDVIDIDSQYLECYLKSSIFRNILDRIQTTGSAQQSIHEKQLLELEITIPCKLSDQKMIYNNLKILESQNFELKFEIAIQLALIYQLRQAFLKEAIQGKLVSNETSDGKTGADLLAEIKTEKEKLIKEKKLKKGKVTKNAKSTTELGIPKNWHFTKFDDLFFVTKLAGFEYSDHMNLSESGEIPVIRAQNVRNLVITKANLLYIDLQTSLLLDRCSLNKECLLITFIGAGIGDVATFNENTRWHLAPNVAKAEPFLGIEDLYSIKYFNYFLISQYGKFEIVKHMKATAQPSLSMETIRDIDIPLPPLEIQNRIVSKLDELMTYCDDLENSVKESQSYNEQLLQQVLQEALEVKEIAKEEILPLVAEEKPIYSISNYPTKICDMTILAGYIIKKLSTQNPKDFGRVKLQKMLHLAEYYCQLSTELKYQKNVAGPYSSELEHLIEPKLKAYRFFDIKKEKLGNNSKVTYTPLSASNGITSLFNQEFKNQSDSINNLLNKFQNKNWEFCEMISTMYAVWNNRLIRKELFTDDLLKKDFLAWDKEKIKFIDQLDYAIDWIRKENLEPIGYGEYIDVK